MAFFLQTLKVKNKFSCWSFIPKRQFQSELVFYRVSFGLAWQKWNFRETLIPHKHTFTLPQSSPSPRGGVRCVFLAHVEFVIDFICHRECVWVSVVCSHFHRPVGNNGSPSQWFSVSIWQVEKVNKKSIKSWPLASLLQICSIYFGVSNLTSRQ